MTTVTLKKHNGAELSGGSATEIVSFKDASGGEESVILGDGAAAGAKKTSIWKTDTSVNLVKVTTSTSFGEDTAEYNLELPGEGITLHPNPSDGKWYKG